MGKEQVCLRWPLELWDGSWGLGSGEEEDTSAVHRPGVQGVQCVWFMTTFLYLRRPSAFQEVQQEPQAGPTGRQAWAGNGGG